MNQHVTTKYCLSICESVAYPQNRMHYICIAHFTDYKESVKYGQCKMDYNKLVFCN